MSIWTQFLHFHSRTNQNLQAYSSHSFIYHSIVGPTSQCEHKHSHTRKKTVHTNCLHLCVHRSSQCQAVSAAHSQHQLYTKLRIVPMPAPYVSVCAHVADTRRPCTQICVKSRGAHELRVRQSGRVQNFSTLLRNRTHSADIATLPHTHTDVLYIRSERIVLYLCATFL